MSLFLDGQMDLDFVAPEVQGAGESLCGVGRRAGYRPALPSLRARREEFGLTLAVLAAEVGVARETLGEIERGEYRASPVVQDGLCRLLGCGIDDVFGASGGRRRVPEYEGEWTRASVAKRILRLNDGPGGPVFCRLVKDGIVYRDETRRRYCYHVPQLESLVPPGAQRLDDLFQEIGLAARQLDYWRRCGRLACFQPWEGSRFYVREDDKQAFLAWFACKPHRRSEERRARQEISDRKRKAVRANMERANAQRRSEREAFDLLRAELGLLDVSEIAEALGVSEGTARAYIRFRELEGEVWLVDNRRVYVAHPDAVRDFKRAYARSVRSVDKTGRSRQAWLDADSVVERYKSLGWLKARAEKHGLSDDQAALLVRAEVQERRRLILRHARGRKPSLGPASHHLEWAVEFAATEAEFERDFELGVRRRLPTNWEIALDVAERDWEARPERWKGYASDPRDPCRLDPALRRRAADRLLKAVKPLQAAQKKITAP
jgi:DNA-binding XRE family transcriptional regulator